MKLDKIEADGLVLLGCGKMGSAMLAGWLDDGHGGGLTPGAVWVIDPQPSDWVLSTGVHVNADLPPCPAVVLPELMLELAWDHFCTDTQRRGGKLTQGAGAKQQGSKLQGPKLPLLASGLPFKVEHYLL